MHRLYCFVSAAALLLAVSLFACAGGNVDNDDVLADDDFPIEDDHAVFDDDDDHESIEIVPITDESGRTIILHGANFMGMEFGWFKHTPEDFERMASWGFNVVRLPMAWHYLEPQPGVWDISYLTDVVEPTVGYAADAGLRVILDMHQWQWSPCSNGNGIPAWTCQEPSSGELEWLVQAGKFWNKPEYLDHFVETWARVAEFFAGDDRIWAYDIFNEPCAGLLSLPWTFENQPLRPLYLRFIDAIREHHSEPYIIFEPSIVNSAGLPLVMDPLPYDRIIYSPHLYPGSIAIDGVGYWFGRQVVVKHLTRRLVEASIHGIPMLISETGISHDAFRAEQYVRDAMELFDRHLVHFTWWTYWHADYFRMGLLDGSFQERDLYMKHLSRPYPTATAGKLCQFLFDVDSKVFTVCFENQPSMNPSMEIFLPVDRHYASGFRVHSSDAQGTWHWAFEENSGILSVFCDPQSPSHTITVLPE